MVDCFPVILPRKVTTRLRCAPPLGDESRGLRFRLGASATDADLDVARTGDLLMTASENTGEKWHEPVADLTAHAGAPRVVISILNWKRWRDTVECLESLRNLTTQADYLCVVVDNGSRDGSADKIHAWAEANLGASRAIADYPGEAALRGGAGDIERAIDAAPSPARLVLIRNRENLGFSGGNNVSITYALSRRCAADYVFLLNNDAAVEADCLERLLAVDRSTGAGVVGPLMMNSDGTRIEFACSGSLKSLFFSPLLKSYTLMPDAGVPYWESLFVNGGAILVRRQVLEALRTAPGSYLDERLYLYWEEVAFCHAAWEKGFRCLIVRAAIVRHKVERSASGYQSPIWYYYSGRNRVLLSKELLLPRWRPLFHLTHIPLRFASMIKHLSAGRYDCARAIFWGMVDGYRGVSGRWKHHDEVTKDYGQS